MLPPSNGSFNYGWESGGHEANILNRKNPVHSAYHTSDLTLLNGAALCKTRTESSSYFAKLKTNSEIDTYIEKWPEIGAPVKRREWRLFSRFPSNKRPAFLSIMSAWISEWVSEYVKNNRNVIVGENNGANFFPCPSSAKQLYARISPPVQRSVHDAKDLSLTERWFDELPWITT